MQGRAVRHEAFESMVLLLNSDHAARLPRVVAGARPRRTPLDDHAWPQADRAALRKDALTLAVQVNGKLRGTIEVAVSTLARGGRAQSRSPNRTSPTSSAAQTPKKVIVVPGKIVNIVV